MEIGPLSLCLIVNFVSSYGRVGFGPGEQDWGYVNVRPNAYMFWWLYETSAKVESPVQRPLVIWLQGGPGASSTGFGNFEEIGPLDMDLNKRNHTWVKNYNILFIDNPVGTGFSYVSNKSALTKNNKEIADDLVACLDGFLEKHNEFFYVPLYITAESYGGKMAVDFALELLKRNDIGKHEANLRGVSLIDSWISPIDSVMNWAPFLLNIGAVDQKGYSEINSAALKVKQDIFNGNFTAATENWGRTESVISKVAHGVDFYNVLTKIPAELAKSLKPGAEFKSVDDKKLEKLMNEQVKVALELNNVTWGSQSSEVFGKLKGDFMRPVTSSVERLLNSSKIKVQVVSGQLDLIVDTPGTVVWVDKLRFPKQEQGQSWMGTARNVLIANGFIEGYYKKLGRFCLYWVNRAGHMVPADNPSAMEVILRELAPIDT